MYIVLYTKNNEILESYLIKDYDEAKKKFVGLRSCALDKFFGALGRAKIDFDHEKRFSIRGLKHRYDVYLHWCER